jgi:hypothetical protein
VELFNEDVVRNYKNIWSGRRSARPDGEYRNVTEQEWRESEEHFDRRKVELGVHASIWNSLPARALVFL